MSTTSGLESLTAVVLNWNQSELAIRSVESLVGDGVPASRIVVVDNGSDDGSWQQLSAQLGSCRLLRLEENVGFARGNNFGARALDGSAYLFVNSDAFVQRPGSTTALLAALDRRNAGVVVPRLLNEDLTVQPSVLPARRPSVALLRASGLSRLVPNDLQPHWGTHWDHGSSREIECAIGPVMLVRGSLWHELGGFPETSFMYAEDLGLCMSATERGYAVWFCGDAEFLHIGGASTEARWDDEARAERVGSANAALIHEHLSPLSARLTIAFTRAGLAARIGYRTLTRDRAAAAWQRGVFRGYGSRHADHRGHE
jgi:N-acetylglucosaminyl-diphospho-decaprenol L-rhamnosyltransferase